MKKIIFIHPIDDYYGATRILAYTINVIKKKYNIEVWVKKNNGALISLVNDKDVLIKEVSCIPVVHSKMFNLKDLVGFFLSNFFFYLLMIKNKKHISLVYVNTFAAVSVSFISWCLCIRNIVHCHESQSHRMFGRLMALQVRQTADKIIVVSDVVRRYVSNGKVCNKISVVWNGIPDLPASYSDDENSVANVTHQENIVNILLVGRLTPEKGYWFFVDVISKLPISIRKKIKVHCVGDAPRNKPLLVDSFKEHLELSGVSECFILHGFKSDPLENINSCDILVVPSVMVDPFPTTVLEGMRSGKCVFTTNNGGATEVIIDGFNGFLCDPYDVDGFVSKLIPVINNQNLMSYVGMNARRFYLSNLTFEHYQSRLLFAVESVFFC